jgi:hypothetical protein
MKIIEKINNIINHPNPHIKILNGIKIRINRVRGFFWCSRISVSTEEALREVRVSNKDIFYKKFKGEINKAEKKLLECPVRMGGAGNLDLIYGLSEYLQAEKVIETGVAYGWSSLAFLLSLKNRNESILVSTDLPYSKETEPYIGFLIPDNLKEKWMLIKKPDKESIPEALKILSKIDICHYDSDKTYTGRMFAYPILWKALRPGGILISDDIGDNLAFKNFSKEIGIEPIVVSKRKGYAGILVKHENNE